MQVRLWNQFRQYRKAAIGLLLVLVSAFCIVMYFALSMAVGAWWGMPEFQSAIEHAQGQAAIYAIIAIGSQLIAALLLAPDFEGLEDSLAGRIATRFLSYGAGLLISAFCTVVALGILMLLKSLLRPPVVR